MDENEMDFGNDDDDFTTIIDKMPANNK